MCGVWMCLLGRSCVGARGLCGSTPFRPIPIRPIPFPNPNPNPRLGELGLGEMGGHPFMATLCVLGIVILSVCWPPRSHAEVSSSWLCFFRMSRRVTLWEIALLSARARRVIRCWCWVPCWGLKFGDHTVNRMTSLLSVICPIWRTLLPTRWHVSYT